VVKRKSPIPRRESNTRTPIVQPAFLVLNKFVCINTLEAKVHILFQSAQKRKDTNKQLRTLTGLLCFRGFLQFFAANAGIIP